ncbi:MAG: right-handed parallel beta-helix repeat-containing protein [Phycisphaerales bacterium]|jgi:parallel beta-helix repeat protein
MEKKILLSLILQLVFVNLVTAATLQVPEQYATIQAAIDDANNGDTVIVNPGTYVENINFNGKNIVLTSINPNDPDIVASTIISTNRTGSVVTFENGETSEAVLAGFTITGGRGTLNEEIGQEIIWGAGIYCFTASPTIKNNLIVNNIAPGSTNQTEGYGGGIGCFGASPTIIYNTIRNNFAYAGGGILTYFGNARVINNLIFNNSATAGGGVAMIPGRIINNTITNNEAETGGNIYVESVPEAGYLIAGNIICNANMGEGLYTGGYNPQNRIVFNNIWGNAGSIDIAWRRDKNPDGNISQNPMFVNPQTNDFRLQIDSPCINAGNPNYSGVPNENDMYGNNRLIHGRIDIGTAEFDGNLRPIADAGDDQSITDVPALITLDASNSYDPDGNTNLTYRWSQVAGPTVTVEDNNEITARFSPAACGIYTFELVVSDGIIGSVPDDVLVAVGTENIPIADAGLPRYTDTEPVVLDGTGSYDPDNSGILQYNWQQISGPDVEIADSNAVTPTISGFTQTESLQLCEFQLIVSDGQNESQPDIVKVWIVPDLGTNRMGFESGTFDPNKPTLIFYGGGDCINGAGSWSSEEWAEQANVFGVAYEPDSPTGNRTYYKSGDMIALHLSRLAPNYNQLIQTMGHSTGGQPTMDAALRLNLTYQDARYAVNRVVFVDGRCRDYASNILDLMSSPVDGEQCWVETYEGTGPIFYPGILNVQVALNDHGAPPRWYRNSLTYPDFNRFNGGLVAGAFWSIIGPGKNLQLAHTPFEEIYRFHWEGSQVDGYMEFFDEDNFPGRLPEPVTLLDPVDVGQDNGVILTCEESENAVGYQLLFGSNPHRVMDYEIISDTPAPPNDVITTLPFAETWWTIKVRDQYGSTIYADPMPISAFNLTMPVHNITSGKRYSFIQDAIDEANYSGVEIVLSPGSYYEQINLKGKSVILRSTNPDNPDIVAATVIKGRDSGPAVTFTSGEDATCVLAGLTITNRGIYCSGASPTITKCNITDNRAAGIKLWGQSDITITNCVIANNAGAGIEMWPEVVGRSTRHNFATITNCTIAGNLQQGVWGSRPTITNSIIYSNGINNNNTQIETNLAVVSYSNVQGTWAGEGNIDVDPMFADAGNGDYHLKSQASRLEANGQSWIQDDVTSPCIDAGDPTSDYAAELQPNGGRINLGAYGGTSQASLSF